MRFSKRRRLVGALESTAMADIIFLLLIFFLLSSSFILQTGIKVELPKVSRTEKEARKDIVVTITAEEKLYLDGIKTSWADFRERLRGRLEDTGSRTVIVKGDEAVSLGRTVQVMDIARQLGAERLAIAAQPLSERERR
ncbi:MAG: biopolymer transporter ExbD [Candidatus Eisenbacteria sp.]|nr:biopolymer transporter ExbD [Candidatus Eisenbacteria bacterium]